MPFAAVGDLIIHYRVEGPNDLPAIAFINSLGTDYRIWDEVALPLKDRFRIVRYDKRGHGLSDVPPPPYLMAEHAADLEALLDHLGIRGSILCGISIGGMIAQSIATTRPDLVRGLILCDTGPKIGPQDLWETRIRQIEAGGIAPLVSSIVDRWFSRSFHEKRSEEVRGWSNMLCRTPAEGYVGSCGALIHADLTAQARAIRVPTLCVCGSEDRSTPPELVRSLADLIPNARFQIVEVAGHLPCIEKPRELTALITQFIEENRLD